MAMTIITVWFTWPFILLFCADFAITAPSSLQNVQEAGANPGVPLAGQQLNKEWEEARQIWNGVRTVKKQLSINTERQRRTRETTTPTPSTLDEYLYNISAPSYVKELYRNISLKDSDEIDATKIRSLPAIHTGDSNGCGFNFSIGEMSSNEILRRAELRIHMKQPNGDQVNAVYLRLYHGSRKGGYKKVSPIREGWVVFDVLNEINQWRAANHPHKKIHFYIVTYTSEEDLIKGQNGKDCHASPIKFHQPQYTNETNSDEEADYMPLLMIYIHDLNTEKFNVSAIVDSDMFNVSDVSAEKRSANPVNVSDPLHGCTKHNLSIDLELFNNIWRLGHREQVALFPRTIDINVCGGECTNQHPIGAPQHSIVLYYLYTRGRRPPHSNNHNVEWSQCCVPVKYKSLEVLFSLPNEVMEIILLKNLSVESCSCLNIIQKSR